MRSALVALALVALVAGCGSSTPDGPTAAEKRVAKQKRAAAKQRARVARCKTTLADLETAIGEVSSRLDVGLSYDDYTRAVGDIRVAYDSVDLDALQGSYCLSIGTNLEQAANKYLKAANVWTKCFDDIECDPDSIKPKLQDIWAAAQIDVAGAKSALEEPPQPKAADTQCVEEPELPGCM